MANSTDHLDEFDSTDVLEHTAASACSSKDVGLVDEQPTLVDEQATLLSNVQIAPATYMAIFHSPQIASRVTFGQFVHLMVPNTSPQGSHVLRRPFSVCTWDKVAQEISIIYQVVGSGTLDLSKAQSGWVTSIIGAIGRPWSAPKEIKNVVAICGGIGIAPLMMLLSHYAQTDVQTTCIMGAANKSRLVGVDFLEESGVKMLLATDDGSAYHHGFCTDLIAGSLQDADYVVICGPDQMEKNAYLAIQDEISKGKTKPGLKVEVSFERRMACGIGACLSCVVDTIDGKKRACVDGPVFSASEVIW